MATIIDELVVHLGLDSSGFQSDARKAQATVTRVGEDARKQSGQLEEGLKKQQTETTKRLKQVGEVGQQTAAQFSRLKNEVLAVFGALATVAGIEKFIKDVTTTEVGLGRLSRAIGDMNVTQLDQFGRASARMGGDAKAAQQSILGLSESIEAMRAVPNPELARVFQNMGVMIADPNGKAHSTSQILADTQKFFAAHAGKEAQFMGGQLHLDQGMINLLSSPNFGEHMGEAAKHGLTGPQDVAAAEDLTKRMADLDQTLTHLGQVVLTDLEPQMGKILKDMTDWIESNPKLAESIETNIKKAIEVIKSFLSAVNDVVTAVGGWKDATEIVLGLWALSKLKPVLDGIGTLTLAFGKAGLLGPLLLIAETMATIQKMSQDIATKTLPPDSPLWTNVPEEEQLKYSQSPASRRRAGHAGDNPNAFNWLNLGSWFGHPVEGLADTTMDDTKRGFLNTLAMPESGGAYNVKNGGSTFSDFGQFPEGVGPGGTSSAAGRYQFTSETWRDLQRKYPGQFDDFQPVTQDRAAWQLASDRYGQNNGGRDLYSDRKSGGHDADIARALRDTWPSLPGGSQSTQAMDAFSAALAKNSGNMPLTPSQGLYNGIKSMFMPGSLPPAFDPAFSNFMRNPPAAASTSNDNSRSIDQSSEVHVGQVVVNGAKNADEVGRNVNGALRKYAYANTFNTGLG